MKLKNNTMMEATGLFLPDSPCADRELTGNLFGINCIFLAATAAGEKPVSGESCSMSFS
jgi:hypothetical protein